MNTLVICRKRGWKRRSRSNKASAFVSFFVISLVSVLIICTINIAYFSVPVHADSTLPIKAIIISLVASLGLNPSSTAFSDAMDNNQIMNSSIEYVADGTISANDIDNALNDIGVDAKNITDMLNTTNEEANAIKADPSVAGTEFENIGSATAGENIAASCNYANEFGEVGFSQGGVAAGVLNGYGAILPILSLNKHTNENFQKMEKLMSSGLRYNLTDEDISQIKAGMSAIRIRPNYPANILTSSSRGVVFACAKSGNKYIYGRCNTTGEKLSVYQYSKGQLTNTFDLDSHSFHIDDYTSPQEPYAGWKVFNSKSDLTSYFNSIKDTDQSQNVYSPDIIGKEGNQKGNWTYNNNQNIFNFPDVTLNYNPVNNQYMTPIDWNDYKTWQNTTNNNTQNNNYVQNKEVFNNFYNNYISNYTAPAPDTNPDIPIQPDKPTNPELTPEQVDQNKEMMLPTSLKDYFPFCIPFDIYTLFTKFDDIEREAPHLQFELDLQRAGKYQIDIDFSDYDDLASLLRLLELFGFIMLLMVSARKIIGD